MADKFDIEEMRQNILKKLKPPKPTLRDTLMETLRKSKKKGI